VTTMGYAKQLGETEAFQVKVLTQLRDLAAMTHCAVCEREVRSVWCDHSSATDELVVHYHCHGKEEERRIRLTSDLRTMGQRLVDPAFNFEAAMKQRKHHPAALKLLRRRNRRLLTC